MEDLIKRLEELHAKTVQQPLSIWPGNPWHAVNALGSNAATPNTYHILASDGGPSDLAKHNLAFAVELWNAYPIVIEALKSAHKRG